MPQLLCWEIHRWVPMETSLSSDGSQLMSARGRDMAGRPDAGMGDFALRTPHRPCQISLELNSSLELSHQTFLSPCAPFESREVLCRLPG